MKDKNILLIGTRSNIIKNRFTGQSIMFDGVVSEVQKCGFVTKVLDVSSRFGKKNFYRVLDYSVILVKMLYFLCACRLSLVYLVTSQSRRGFYRDFAIIMLCRLFAVKVIAHQYGANYNQMLDSMTKLERKLLIKTIDYISVIIVEGEYMKNQFSFYDGYFDKVMVIPNGLPTEGKNIGYPKIYNENEPFTLFYLSNLIYSKGYFDVLKAVDCLVNNYKLNVKCVFAGQFMSAVDDKYPNISNKTDFDNYILQHNLTESIKYFPGLYGNEKDFYFYNSNAFILPTYYINEGQPVSILEAMAYGCVPIVTNYRHIPMMINKENGCFVKPSSPESICEVVISLMNNPEIYNSKSIQAIDDYRMKYKFDIFSSKILDVINEILHKK